MFRVKFQDGRREYYALDTGLYELYALGSDDPGSNFAWRPSFSVSRQCPENDRVEAALKKLTEK